MKRFIVILMLFLLAACNIKPKTPIPAIDPVIFEKEGGKISVMMSHAFIFVYDEALGYDSNYVYDDVGTFDHEVLQCNWVTFMAYRMDISEDLFISVKPNETGEERSLTMMFENVWNTQHSGRSSITVIQKGD